MEHFKRPVKYLIESDFYANGDIVSELDRKPLFVMIFASGCVHCKNAKTDFQRLANSRVVETAVIQADGTYPGERELARRIEKIYPNFRGFPSYMLFYRGMKYPYDGGRDYASMRYFVTNAR